MMAHIWSPGKQESRRFVASMSPRSHGLAVLKIPRGDGANLGSRGARVTQIRGLDVATFAPFRLSENSAWGWHTSGVPESNSHTDSLPRCRHARTVLPFWFWACNSHKDSWPRGRHAGLQSRHARTVSLFWVAACNSHKDSGPQSRHARTIYTNSRSTASAAAMLLWICCGTEMTR